MGFFGWFAAVALVLRQKGNDQIVQEQRSVYLIWAWSWDHAFKQSLNLGKKEEYVQVSPRESMRHIFVKIEFLDFLGPILWGAREVYWNPGLYQRQRTSSFDLPPHPEAHVPRHIGL